VASHLAFNTAVSFASDTDWLGYAAESAMGYLVQMTGLRLRNFCAAATDITLLTAKLLDWCVVLPKLSLTLLTAVPFSVATWRLGPAIFASIVSVLTYDLFFIPPLYTLSIPP
jgi:K+-sensing histidine kinase KdpD